MKYVAGKLFPDWLPPYPEFLPGLCGKREVEECPYPLEGYENPAHLQYSDIAKGDRIYVTLLVPFGEECPQVDVESVDVSCDHRILTPFEGMNGL